MEHKEISRRDFLKSAGAVGIGAAALSFFGVNAFAADAVSSASVAEAAGGSSSGEAGSGEIVPVTTDERVFGYAGPGDWLGKAPDMPIVTNTLDCDVAVVGLGHAGTQAFLAAAEMGAKVIGIEAQSEDTHTWYGEDFGCWNSEVQVKKAGFGPYDLGEVVDEFITRGGGRSFPEIVRLYVHNSGPTMDHMLEIAKEMGVDKRV